MLKNVNLRGLIFDKDGTLFDFQRTWGSWAVSFLRDLSGGDAAVSADLAARLGLDVATQTFHPTSPVIAGSFQEIVDLLMPGLSLRRADLIDRMLTSSQSVPLAEVVPLRPLMTRLQEMGFVLGVVTNDAVDAADAHLRAVQIKSRMAFIAGADSGFGAKPDPGPCHAFCAAVGLPAHEVAMIGDSTHDLRAGRAAGMTCIGVLTGPAGRDDLAPFADMILADIGELPDILAGSRT